MKFQYLKMKNSGYGDNEEQVREHNKGNLNRILLLEWQLLETTEMSVFRGITEKTFWDRKWGENLRSKNMQFRKRYWIGIG